MGITYPNIWGQGAIFAPSGLEMHNSQGKSLVCTLLGDKIGLELKTPIRASLYFNCKNIENIEYSAVVSDVIKARTQNTDGAEQEFIITFYSENTVVMKYDSLMDLHIDFDENIDRKTGESGTELFVKQNEKFALKINKIGGIAYAALSYGENCAQSVCDAIASSPEAIAEKYLSFYSKLPRPEFKDQDEEMLYYKCFSVMKSMVYSPEGRFSGRWTTPDRYPHKDCWLWDSAFHVFGLKYISKNLAEEALAAMLDIRHSDGYIPHRASVDEDSDVTQPPVLAWAVCEICKYSNDFSFAEKYFDDLQAYLNWNIKNRDDNKNGLLEWVVHEDSVTNRCDECGMDNTPRFDGESEMDCIDFSSYVANEARCLKFLAEKINRTADGEHWGSVYENMKKKINELLWDDEQKFYFDRRFDKSFSPVKSVVSFLPLFAGVCDKERAAELVRHLNNPDEFNTGFPIPTVSADYETYKTLDMFNGTTWLNFNYMIAEGLDEYGYFAEAKRLREATLETVKKWYLSDGVIYEFYDSRDKVSPRRLSRKGIALQPYLPDMRIQCVRDFSWGSCFVADYLNKRQAIGKNEKSACLSAR